MTTTDPVQPFAGPSLEQLQAKLARARRAQQRAIARGDTRFAPEADADHVPAWRRTLAARMPYPHAQLDHLDGDARSLVDEWLGALTDRQARLDGRGPGNLLVLGRSGAGKTVMACAIAGHLADRLGWRVAFTRVTDLLADERPDGTHTLARHLGDADAVVLDDLAVGGLTDWGADTLSRIVDDLVHPAGSRLPVLLIVTANYAPADLAEYLPERLWSRVSGDAWTYIADGDDRRGETLPVLPPPPRGPGRACPHGCDSGWLPVDAEHVERVAGPEPDDDAVAAAIDVVLDAMDPYPEGDALTAVEQFVARTVRRHWEGRHAAAANSVRPCPYCRARRPDREDDPDAA